MCEVGVNALGLKVFDVKIAQIVVRNFAGIEGFAAQLGQSYHSVAGRAAAGLSRLEVGDMVQQLCATGGVDQRHVALADAHLLEQSVCNFVFGVDQGIADGVEIVVGHESGLDLNQ